MRIRLQRRRLGNEAGDVGRDRPAGGGALGANDCSIGQLGIETTVESAMPASGMPMKSI